MSLVILCAHCSTECSGKYCPNCQTADKRREMDEVNAKNFEEHGLHPYVCKVCEEEKRIREENKAHKLKYGI